MPSSDWAARSAALAMMFLLTACKLPIDLRSDPAIPKGANGYLDTVQVRYLGVGGFLVRLGDDVVLTAPLYSNPSLIEESLLPIFPDASRIGRFHPPGAADRDDVRAILVGHAHYDHLMDVPWIWRWSPRAVIVGTVTTRNVLASYARAHSPVPAGFPDPIPVVPQSAIVALNDPADDRLDSRNCVGQKPSPKAKPPHECPVYSGMRGKPLAVGASVEISGFCGRHPDQFPGIHQAPGCVADPLAVLPTMTRDHYLEGESIAYLIDFVQEGRIRFRIYYQDVAADGPFGKIPDDVLQQHPVNLALLCVGNWNLVENHDAVSIVDNLKPANVILGHWESFFRPQDEPLTPAPTQFVGQFFRKVKRRLSALGLWTPKALVLPAPQVLKTYPVV